MVTKILLGGIAGGLVLFAWSFLAHLPPVGTAGERRLTPEQDEAVLAALRGAMKDRAIYPVPGFDPSQSAEERKARTAKFEAGPAAVIAYSPRPADRTFAGSSFATFFLLELLASFAAALLGACIAAGLSGSLGYWPRVLLIAAIGLVGTLDVDGGYWNWYGYPTSFFAAQLVDHLGGWFFAGLVLARICRP